MPEVPTRASRNGRSAIQLAPMSVPKASDVLAGQLREAILDGRYAEGDVLPPERELVVQSQMSRTTVREALKILEVQGLVRIKAGRSGGAFVQRPDRESVATSVTLLIRANQLRLADLLETRQAIEPFCAQLAARNRTDEDLATLDAANEALRAENTTRAQFLQANVDWHVAVSVASHNELLNGLMMALSRAIYAGTDSDGFVDAEVRRTTGHAHHLVTEAIRDRDADAAMRRMSRHVHTYAEAVLKVDERTEIALEDLDDDK